MSAPRRAADKAAGGAPPDRIAAAFARARNERRPALIPYLVAGDPDLATTRSLVQALARGGADLVELGVPFSDPIADGPVNQRAAERALRNGVSLADVLALAAELAAEGAPPIVLFTYYNPIHRMGPEAFATEAQRARVSGVLVTDLPPEEAGDLRAALDAHDIDLIYLLSPTSGRDRVELIARAARGFLYFISRTGVTGVRQELPRELEEQVRAIRAVCPLPIAVGFGISRAEQVRTVAGFADGVVVGSALVRLVEETANRAALPAAVEAFCRALAGR
jgi:tryptophan synthase alpha chain